MMPSRPQRTRTHVALRHRHSESLIAVIGTLTGATLGGAFAYLLQRVQLRHEDRVRFYQERLHAAGEDAVAGSGSPRQNSSASNCRSPDSISPRTRARDPDAFANPHCDDPAAWRPSVSPISRSPLFIRRPRANHPSRRQASSVLYAVPIAPRRVGLLSPRFISPTRRLRAQRRADGIHSRPASQYQPRP
jgi:hypothetical protein